MLRMILAFCAAIFLVSSFARAQSAEDVVWVQIEAHPNLATATDRARAYGTLLEDLNGFALGGGWYGIVVGPYRRADADVVLRTYKSEGLIPSDSFIQFSRALRQQFWPVGANVLNRGVLEPPASVALPSDAPAEAPQPAEEIPLQPADETPSEARRSERALSADERKQLQVALKWAGFYNSAIDGAFGRGTRNSMAAWQAANGYEQTGILTTVQRAAMIRQYNAVLDGLGMKLVRDAASGIEMVLPTEVVKFSRYEPPFVHFDATGDIAARVLFISQDGDQATLFGLYDIMQTLEIVPLEGPRQRNTRSFELTGANARIVSHTQATLQDGQIKGFTLIWPADDEDRRTRVLTEMQKSFARIPGVLSPAAGSNDAQSIDLVAGLEVRKPKLSRSGFFITPEGDIATTSEAVQSCGRITLDNETDADLIADDSASGIAFLRPKQPLAPQAVASFASDAPRLKSEIAVAGYPYEGVLSAAAVTYGTLADWRGLRGEESLARLSLTSQPGDAGGPVFDDRGRVMGLLLPKEESSQQLPQDVKFVLKSSAVTLAARSAGLSLDQSAEASLIAPEDLSTRAQAMTVLVSCWE